MSVHLSWTPIIAHGVIVINILGHLYVPQKLGNLAPVLPRVEADRNQFILNLAKVTSARPQGLISLDRDLRQSMTPGVKPFRVTNANDSVAQAIELSKLDWIICQSVDEALKSFATAK